MTTNPVSAARGASVGEVYAVMLDEGFRHMPVVDDGDELVGIVSQRDIAAALGGKTRDDRISQAIHLEDLTVAQVMTGSVDTADPDDDLAAAAQVLLDNKISCLPVVEGTRLVGILTESDFVRLVAEGEVR